MRVVFNANFGRSVVPFGLLAAPFLVLEGVPGSGKSSLLSELCKSPEIRHYLISHFVGASVGSTDLRRILLRLCLSASSTSVCLMDADGEHLSDCAAFALGRVARHFVRWLGPANG
jgi:thymidylate kinase